jgi:toxoflavin biosynthesis protein ToxD
VTAPFVPPPTIAPQEPEADLALSGGHLESLQTLLRKVARHPVDELVHLVESPEVPLHERHGAGLVLALLGDPRINPEAPTMIEIPSAEVPMGISETMADAVTSEWSSLGVQKPWIMKEVPQHIVRVQRFRIARYPATNAEYLRYVLDDPTAERPTCWAHGVYPMAASNQPVYALSPDAADSYARWLSAKTGRSFRLPTEAEWEYAATGGDGRQFPWGESWDPNRSNTAECGPLTTTPVGIYVEGDSPFGVADMAGNVEEYVSDPYRPYPGAEAVHDDLVQTHGEDYRIARGGSYARHGDLARCQRRHGWYPSQHFAMGFRLAETVV